MTKSSLKKLRFRNSSYPLKISQKKLKNFSWYFSLNSLTFSSLVKFLPFSNPESLLIILLLFSNNLISFSKLFNNLEGNGGNSSFEKIWKFSSSFESNSTTKKFISSKDISFSSKKSGLYSCLIPKMKGVGLPKMLYCPFCKNDKT